MRRRVDRGCVRLTLAADIDTAKAFQLARKVDTTGERTLGIFTKVDRVEGIEAENWLGPFRGDDYKRRLHLGYFVRDVAPELVLTSVGGPTAYRRRA